MLYRVARYPDDIFDGVPHPPTVVTTDQVLDGTRNGSVYVQPGATLVLAGINNGTLTVASGASVVIRGQQRGTLHVSHDASVRVLGAVQGSIHNEGDLLVERGGTAAGSLHNEGRFVLRGRQGGATSGTGSFEIEDGGTIVQPVVRNGVSVYEWTY